MLILPHTVIDISRSDLIVVGRDVAGGIVCLIGSAGQATYQVAYGGRGHRCVAYFFQSNHILRISFDIRGIGIDEEWHFNMLFIATTEILASVVDILSMVREINKENGAR